MKIKNNRVVYQSGKGGYAGYRIPSIVKAADGSLLAFCEGRYHNLKDSGYIDIIVKKSTDNGLSWLDFKTVASDGINTFDNCCCVTDKSTKRIHMVCNFNQADHDESMIIKGEAYRKAYYLYSDDNGDTWSKHRDITTQVKNDGWGWLAFGPCHGIQTRSGRIVFPCNHTNVHEYDAPAYYSYAVYSDDGCKTFEHGEDVVCQVKLTTFFI